MSKLDNLALSRKLFWILLLSSGLLWYDKIIAPNTGGYKISAPEVVVQKPLTIMAVGDILLSRHVGAKIEQAKNPNFPFEKLKTVLESANITFGNLECPLSQNPFPIRKGLVFRCPSKYVPGLLSAGFDVLSTANNHALDQGILDLEFTIDYLKSQNILPVGSGSTLEMAWQPVIIERDGRKIGFLAASYASVNDNGKSTNSYIARVEDTARLKSEIFNLKSKADFIIVSMHAGTEYTRTPNPKQIEFAHAAIDTGADVIIGHHPHWIQTIEIYRGKPIFYSLGNFVFDQEWSRETKEGLLIRLKIENKKLKAAELLPIVIENYCCPRLAGEKEKQAILAKIGLQADEINFGN